MKHIISCIMALFLLTGCSTIGNSSTVNFYYPRAEFEYNSADGVIDSEVRDNGSNASTSSLLSLYLKGPVEIRFSNPFPANVKLLSAYTVKNTLYITLADEFATLSGSSLILACACIGRTGMELSGASEAKIQCNKLLLDGKPEVVINDTTFFYSDKDIDAQSEDK